MAGFLARSPSQPQPVRLELSGRRLTDSLARLVAGCEARGGIEQYVEALGRTGARFRDVLGADGERVGTLEPRQLRGLCTAMPTVRRRIGPWLQRPAFDALREDIVRLLDALRDAGTVDERLGAFGGLFCGGERPRWVRDLGAELLHRLSAERFPLMSRWVWDAAANTGVLREIWFGGEDGGRIDVPDSYRTFVTLREELSGFLTGNGMFRDLVHYVDLLCAQVYAEYICAQGGSYLRVDFAGEEDPWPYTARLLGLEGLAGGAREAPPESIEGGRLDGRSAAARRSSG